MFPLIANLMGSLIAAKFEPTEISNFDDNKLIWRFNFHDEQDFHIHFIILKHKEIYASKAVVELYRVNEVEHFAEFLFIDGQLTSAVAVLKTLITMYKNVEHYAEMRSMSEMSV